MTTEDYRSLINNRVNIDCQVYDFSCLYFCDEVRMILEKDGCFCTEILFSQCRSVSVKIADGARLNSIPIKRMTKGQLGFYLQALDICDSSVEGCLEVSIFLSMLDARICCQKIEVNDIEKSKMSFQWHETLDSFLSNLNT